MRKQGLEISRRSMIGSMVAIGAISGVGRLAVALNPTFDLQLNSSDSELQQGFEWAKHQALSYAHAGEDPVGPWYEASLPGRSAFCMRDVSHMSTGAQVLGLAAQNKNMLRRFAEGISPARDWCSYWEINKDNLPAPVDYKDDRHFWYNLPANFDVICTCYRMYLWTRDRAYLESPYLDFYERSMTDYIRTWDRDNDGIPDQRPSEKTRGIPTYVEDFSHPVAEGADLLASEYGAYRACAEIETLRNNQARALAFQTKALALRAYFNSTWWNPQTKNFYLAKLPDGSFRSELTQTIGNSETEFILIFELPDGVEKIRAALRQLLGNDVAKTHSPSQIGGVEGRSYLPGILYQYGEVELAYQKLAEMWDPHLARREYPEVSFTVVGNIVGGLMGIQPLNDPRGIETLSSLPNEKIWVEVANIPILGNRITVKHSGRSRTVLTNRSGSELIWRASFPGTHKQLMVNGVGLRAVQGQRLNHVQESYVRIPVGAGESTVAEIEA
jgi:hypothetical protein